MSQLNIKGLVAPAGDTDFDPNSLEDTVKWNFAETEGLMRVPAGIPSGPSYRNAVFIWLVSIPAVYNHLKEHGGHDIDVAMWDAAHDNSPLPHQEPGDHGDSSSDVDSVFSGGGKSDDTDATSVQNSQISEGADSVHDDCPLMGDCLLHNLKRLCDMVWPPAGSITTTEQKTEFLDQMMDDLKQDLGIPFRDEVNGQYIEAVASVGWDADGYHTGNQDATELIKYVADVLLRQAYILSGTTQSRMHTIFTLDVQPEISPPGYEPFPLAEVTEYQVELSVPEEETLDLSEASITHWLRRVPPISVMPPDGINFARFRPLVLNVRVMWWLWADITDTMPRRQFGPHYVKSDGDITFVEHLDLTPMLPPVDREQGRKLNYRLTSIILQQGTSGDGHYMNVVRAPDDRWYAINNENVTTWGDNDEGSLAECLNRVGAEFDSMEDSPEFEGGYKVHYLTYVKAGPGNSEYKKIMQRIEEDRKRKEERKKEEEEKKKKKKKGKRKADDEAESSRKKGGRGNSGSATQGLPY